MSGMQYADGAADYYVPRHAAWLPNAESAGSDMHDADVPDAVTEPIAPQPVAAAPMATPQQETEPTRFWRGRKRDGSAGSVASA
jgi:hypothetical protein